ncbi:tyrosinase cofactor [Actinoplanes sp. NBC_00393]|uniref:tyrosinase family oxidase copper chaperone n=1 Tax=Actinoplanes sp. NBC_00393 TaxID=2975953 RepID=UPI002E20F3A4
MKRRDVLRYSAAGAVTATTALVAAPGLATEESAAAPAGPRDPRDPRDFDEKYKGRKIRGRHLGRDRDELHIDNKKLALTLVTTLFVPEDGSPEHVGLGYISAINHYDPVEINDVRNRDGLRKLARKVVDILGDIGISDEAAKAHQH